MESKNSSLLKNPEYIGAGMTVLYMCLVALLAQVTDMRLAFFPELAALTYGVFTKPLGPWAKAPLALIVTPTLTAIFGTLITRYFEYDAASVAVCVFGGIALIKLTRSPVFPAASAGLIPVVFGISDFKYPIFIAFDMTGLVLLSIPYRSLLLNRSPVRLYLLHDNFTKSAGGLAWVPYYSIAIFLAFLAGHLTGYRLVLFPPLLVLGYEMIANPDSCPWSSRPPVLLLTCALSATIGYLAVATLGVGIASVAISMTLAILALRITRLFVPPALAVSVIPQIMPVTTPAYPLMVLGGVMCVLLVFYVKGFVAEKDTTVKDFQ